MCGGSSTTINEAKSCVGASRGGRDSCKHSIARYRCSILTRSTGKALHLGSLDCPRWSVCPCVLSLAVPGFRASLEVAVHLCKARPSRTARLPLVAWRQPMRPGATSSQANFVELAIQANFVELARPHLSAWNNVSNDWRQWNSASTHQWNSATMENRGGKSFRHFQPPGIGSLRCGWK